MNHKISTYILITLIICLEVVIHYHGIPEALNALGEAIIGMDAETVSKINEVEKMTSKLRLK